MPKRRRPIDPRAQGATLDALRDDLARRFYSESLQSHVSEALVRFFAFLKARRISDLRSVKEEHVNAYVRDLARAISARGTPYAVSTRRWHLQSVTRLFGFLEREGALLHNPTLDLELPSWRLLPRAVINQEQAKRLVAHPDPHTSRGKRSRAILELLYGTGIRVSECERLDLGDVDLAQGVLFVRDGKGRKDRVVPVVGRAADALDLYLRDARPLLVKDSAERALFLTRFGTRVRAKSIRYLVLMNRKGAEIPLPVTPHGLRHACATHLVKNGADVRHVQKLLGHQSLTSTQIYTDVAAADLARMLEKAHPRERDWRRRAARSGRKR
jgi:integrase/recombinase XerD